MVEESSCFFGEAVLDKSSTEAPALCARTRRHSSMESMSLVKSSVPMVFLPALQQSLLTVGHRSIRTATSFMGSLSSQRFTVQSSHGSQGSSQPFKSNSCREQADLVVYLHSIQKGRKETFKPKLVESERNLCYSMEEGDGEKCWLLPVGW